MADREDEPIEIVKRIETPHTENEESGKKEEIVHVNENIYVNDSVSTDEEYRKKEKKSSKKIFPLLFGITTIGIMGYLGFNYLNKENCTQTQTTTSPTVKSENKQPAEITTYIEELAIKKDSQKIEENVIATLSAQKKQAEAEAQKEKEASKPIPKEPVKEVLALISTPKKIEKKEVIVKKKETVKVEKNVQKKEVTKKRSILKYESIKPRVFTVRKGDSLASIAKRFYGNPMDFKRIVRANSRIRSHKTSLRLGEKIIIPRKDNKKTRRYIIVEKGNTLASISKKVYGSTDKISKIVRANYKIKSKRSTLRLGQKVYVPK
jgi:nucleoid-associated protein YgaU